MRASAEAARCACAVTRREFRKYPGRRGITNRTDAGEDLGGDAESAEVTLGLLFQERGVRGAGLDGCRRGVRKSQTSLRMWLALP